MNTNVNKKIALLVLVLVFSVGCHKNTTANKADFESSNKTTNIDSANFDTENAFTPIVMSVLAPPVPVKGSDGRYHITYELFLANSNTFDWEVLTIEVLDGSRDGVVLETVSGDGVKNDMRLVGTRQPTALLEPTQSGLVFMTFAVDNKEAIPETLLHRLTITVPGGLPEFIISFLELPQDQENIVEYGAQFDVSNQDVFVFGPPFEGPGWVAVNGCCDSFTHVRSDLAVNSFSHILLVQARGRAGLHPAGSTKIFVGPDFVTGLT